MAGAPERGVVQNPLAQGTPGTKAIVATPGVQLAARSDMSKVGAADATLAQVLQTSAEWANQQYKESLKEDFVNGKMAQQQGKALDEYNMVATSHAFVSGFRSMQAQTLSDKVYAEQAAAIQSGDYELTPDQYRAKQTYAFKGVLTGNEETDRYLTQLAVANNSKLAKEHLLKHEEWKVQETVSSARDLIASKAKLALTSPTDAEELGMLLKNPQAIPGMQGMSTALSRKAVADGIVQALDNGSDAALVSLKGILSKVQGPQPTEAGNINLAGRPRVKNEDGSVSTVRSLSFNDGTSEVLIPTVVGGKVVSPQEAIAEYKRTGQHLGKFNTPEEATAYAESLHKQQEGAYVRKGIEGLEGAGFSKEQLSAIRDADKRYRDKKQAEFNQGFEDEFNELTDKAAAGKISREEMGSKLKELTARYQKDDEQFRTLAYRSMLSKYGEQSDEILGLMLRIDQGARNGVSWEQLKPAVNQYLDKMNATQQTRFAVFRSAAQGVEGFQRRMEAKADAAAERAAARQERLNEAVSLANSGNGFALDTEGRRLAFMARNNAEDAAVEKARAEANGKGLYFDETQAQERKAANMAQYISRNGVVSPLHADMWTAGMNAIVDGGKVSPLTQMSLIGFAELAKVNPALAMQHLHGEDTKAVGKIVMDNLSAGLDPNQAVNMAMLASKPAQGTKDMTKAAKSVSADMVAQRAPGLFVGANSSFGFGIGRKNAQAAMQSPVLQNALVNEANRIKSMYPQLSDAQAVDQAGMLLGPKVGIVGPNVLVSKSKDMATMFNLGEPLRNQDDLHHIVMHAMSQPEIGPRAFGKDWEKTSGIIDSINRGLGDPTKMHMALDNITETLVVTTYNEDGSLGASARIPTSAIGTVWRNSGMDPSQVRMGSMKAAGSVRSLGKVLIGNTKGIGKDESGKPF